MRRDDEFGEYIAARLGSLRRTAYLLCQDWQQADDLVQTAITKLYVHWGRARTFEHTDAYARAILVRQFFTERRSGWGRLVSLRSTLPEAASPAADIDGVLDVRAAMTALPPRQRATLVLRFYCDMNVDQTADVLGCSAGTVKSQTAKALASLRRALEPGGDTPTRTPGRGRGSATIPEVHNVG